jgi:imidazolonepropionase-like amidohydrolase
MAMPGIIDMHNHILEGARCSSSHCRPPCRSRP